MANNLTMSKQQAIIGLRERGWKPLTPLEAIWAEIAEHATQNPGWLEATSD